MSCSNLESYNALVKRILETILISDCKQQKWTLGNLSKKKYSGKLWAPHKIEGKTKEASLRKTGMRRCQKILLPVEPWPPR